MAAGIFQGRAIITDSPQTLDAITGGTQTYGYLSLRTSKGIVLVGNSGITLQNGFPLDNDETMDIPVSVAGAAINFRGSGELEFFGIATA
jgi:hypothetical protein